MPSERCLRVQEMLTGQRLCQSSSHNDAVLAALNQQRSDGILCDITLIAEEQKFHAHKAVLAACSDYFRAMFSLCMVESEADEVNLHGVTSLGLKQALDFAYTGQELNSFNYLDLYKLADLFNLTLLENAVIGFLVKHLSELLKSHPEEVLALPYCLLREVFKSDRLTSLSEEQIWQNKWLSRSPMLQRRVYHSMAAVQRKLYVLGGNDLDYNNDRILVRHIDSYSIDADQWTRCSFNMLTGQNESGVAVHNGRIYLVGGYSIWTNEPLACIQVLDVSKEGKEEVFYGPTLPFASNGIAACFLPAPYFTCPNLQTLQVPHHRIGTM
uniref:Kelch like family member 32 n=1 Tax=Cyanistes caeruleus TaxID=156563 RepID=A0A8C0ZFT5_CYACU